MKKNKVESFLNEVDDMYLGDKVGASLGTAIGIGLSLVALGLTTSNLASQKYSCGVVWSCSAECRKDHKAC